MILFHSAALDSGDLRLWRRALLPAYALRQAGVPSRILHGAVRPADLAGARAIVFTSAITPDTVRWCRLARDAGLRVVLDLADTRSLGDSALLRAAASTVHGVFAANAALAAVAARCLGIAESAVRVVPDPASTDAVKVLAGFPVIGLRLLLDTLRVRAIDAVRRLRRWVLGDRRPPRSGRRIVWFGDGAGLNEEGGLGELLLAVGALVDLEPDVPFHLYAIGASRRQFRRTVARLPIATEFRRLSIVTLARDLKGADLCFLPGGGDALSQAGTAARAEMARRLGIPVITTARGGAVRADATTDWEPALRARLSGRLPACTPPAEPDDATRLAAWLAILGDGYAAAPIGQIGSAGATEDRLRVLFLLQQFQDLDLICPIAEAASAMPDLDISLAVLTKIAGPASRRLQPLREAGAQISFWHSRDVAAGKIGLLPGNPRVAVTASEGSGPAARYGRAFVEAANAAGAATLNLQHGLDNAGLTFGPSGARIRHYFASNLVLTWGGFDRLTEAAGAETRAKVIPVGCPKRRLQKSDVPDFPGNGRPIIAVFENLHWRRYDDAYRHRFVRDLIATTKAAPDLLFLLKPHMGGQWFTRAQTGEKLPDNLIVASPGAPAWRRFTADSFLAHAAGVITTPSTIALDAARYDLPTALVAYGIEADNYAPLPRIERAEDWTAFVQQIRAGSSEMGRVRAFRDAVSLPGDAVARILEVIRLAAAGASQAEIVAKLEVSARTP